MKLTIGHLYPDLLNLYGDRGNIQCMKKRLEWRGIEAEVKEFQITDKIDFSSLDIVLLGGGSDREQLLVCDTLKKIKAECGAYVEDGGTLLAVCGGKPGAGERVMHTLMTLVEDEQMILEVASTNARAIHLYEKLGFLPTREIKRWYRVL